MRSLPHRLTRSAGLSGPSGIFGPTFFAPLQDAGLGAVNLALAKGLGSATFTRATTAWAKLSTGLWASVASGTARAQYLGIDTTVGAYGGYLAEGARTNQCLQSRDLSNASWTKLNTTAAKDQVGIDGAANSASSLTATANSGTCLQTITEAAALSALSVFIKRITGTGTITLQQGATTLDVTASINSSTYTRVELDATVLNPAIGIIMGTSGDKIAVDMVQFENGAFATSPIPTTTVAVTRNADVLNYPSAGNVDTTLGTVYAEFVPLQTNQTSGKSFVSINTASTDRQLVNITASTIELWEGGSKANIAYTPVIGTLYKAAASFNNAANVSNIVNNGVVGTPSTTTGTGASPGALYIGGDYTGAAQICGTIRNVHIWTRALTNVQLIGLTT